jgi:hypothetical protein
MPEFIKKRAFWIEYLSTESQIQLFIPISFAHISGAMGIALFASNFTISTVLTSIGTRSNSALAQLGGVNVININIFCTFLLVPTFQKHLLTLDYSIGPFYLFLD